MLALSLLGIATGQITGLSRDSAVHAVLPAVLGLMGGATIYLIGAWGKELQTTVVAAVIGLSINLVVGVYWGSYSRVIYERWASGLKSWRQRRWRRRMPVTTPRSRSSSTIAVTRGTRPKSNKLAPNGHHGPVLRPVPPDSNDPRTERRG